SAVPAQAVDEPGEPAERVRGGRPLRLVGRLTRRRPESRGWAGVAGLGHWWAGVAGLGSRWAGGALLRGEGPCAALLGRRWARLAFVGAGWTDGAFVGAGRAGGGFVGRRRPCLPVAGPADRGGGLALLSGAMSPAAAFPEAGLLYAALSDAGPLCAVLPDAGFADAALAGTGLLDAALLGAGGLDAAGRRVRHRPRLAGLASLPGTQPRLDRVEFALG
ncbi:hypothetical protein JYK22_28190, partial [Nonomuraea sp. RK-328]|nr:hypothetical protein [Nonomuraea sp. RK-328]